MQGRITCQLTFSSAGARIRLGDLDIPIGARVLDIGDDYWVLLETDELDVECVRVYELLKSQ